MIIEMVPLEMVNDGYYNYPRIQIERGYPFFEPILFIENKRVHTRSLNTDIKVFESSELMRNCPELFRERCPMTIGFHENEKIMYEEEYFGPKHLEIGYETILVSPVYKKLILSELLKIYFEENKTIVNEKGQVIKQETDSLFNFLEI